MGTPPGSKLVFIPHVLERRGGVDHSTVAR